MSAAEPTNLEYHMETLRQLQEEAPDMQERFNSIYDTLAHTAPEIINKKAWTRIYQLCSTYFTDMDNERHLACFRIYNERYIQFKNKSST